MFIIDDNLLKLAKMQETLLKMSNNNRYENVQKYKEIITKIDKQAFESLTKELDNYIKHNQDKIEELKFLELIKNYYNQLTELQLGFIKVYQTYSNEDIKLSDLSQIDIDYIDKRISVISGYLSNQKNLETNKKSIEELNSRLIKEEKQHEFLETKLLEYEEQLRDNFLNAEGRIIEDGKMQYVSIITEYEKINYDLKKLLTNPNNLKDILKKIEESKNEIEEKLKTAEICYNSSPNSLNRQIYNDIEMEYYKIKYNLILLKIIELLSKNNKEYDAFLEKREKLLDLIENRTICLKKMNINISIDPFNRTKISEQITDIDSKQDNEKIINKLKKEIAKLNELIEEMIQNNENYQKELLYKKNSLLKEQIIEIDIDKSDYNENASEKFNDLINIKAYTENQVVNIRKPLDSLNMRIVKDKTNNLIKRVNDMILIDQKRVSKQVISTPELAIIPITNEEQTDEYKEKETEKEFISIPTLEIKEIADELSLNNSESQQDEDTKKNEKIISLDHSLFTTVNPFEDIVLFEDKIEDKIENSKEDLSLNLNKNNNEEISNLSIVSGNQLPKEEPTELKVELDTPIDEMPEAFWTTQEDNEQESDIKETMPSFDEQIEALLSSDNNNKNLVKKLSA